MLDHLLSTYYHQIQYASYYLLCGVIFNLLYDLLISSLDDETNRFDNWQRFGTAIIWPIFLAMFIYNFIKAIFKNEK